MRVFKELLALHDLDAWENILAVDFRSTSLDFYGMTDQELRDQESGMVEAYYDLITSPAGKACSPLSLPQAPHVHALLLLYASLFERIGAFAALHGLVHLLPPTVERNLIEAILLYRDVADARRDFENRIGRLVHLVIGVSAASSDKARFVARAFYLEGLRALAEPRSGRTSALFVREFGISFETEWPDADLLATVKDSAGKWTKETEALLKTTRGLIVEAIYSAALRIAQVEDEATPTPPESEGALETTTELPPALESFLFDTLCARYTRKGMAASVCFDWDASMIPVYLGTYFPRSFVESQNIFTDLLANRIVRQEFGRKQVLRVLDIGAGPGGNALGLLNALKARNIVVPVQVTCVDGNPHMVTALKLVSDWAQKQCDGRLTFNVLDQNLGTTLTEFADALTRLSAAVDAPYDIVMSWKFLSEFYSRSYAQSIGVIERMLAFAGERLSEFGVCVLADITTKDSQVEFFSQTLQRETAQHLVNNSRLKRILPRSCAEWGQNCAASKGCFKQTVYVVSHRQCSNDVSKITLSVVAPSSFAERIMGSCAAATAYRVNPFAHGICRRIGTAPRQVESNVVDGFRLGG